MINPLVSIIIPIYKVEKYISRCLDSILRQTFQDFEIILVNDASPDNSRKIAEKYAENDKRMIIIDNEENSGASWSRMVGYSNARGTYLTFCDPDDFLPNDALQSLYTAMIEDSRADICIGNYQRIFPNGNTNAVFKNQLNYGQDKWSVAKSTLLSETPHYLWNKIYKSELFKYPIITHKNFSKSSDEFLFFQLLQNCQKVICINKLVYYYFDNDDSASYNKSNVIAMRAMLISYNYVDNQYKNLKDFKHLLHKWKTHRCVHLMRISDSSKPVLQLLFKSRIDYIFTPWNLISNFSKRNGPKVFFIYLKSRILSFI